MQNDTVGFPDNKNIDVNTWMMPVAQGISDTLQEKDNSLIA